MVYYWLRIYVRVIPVVAVLCLLVAIILAVAGDSPSAGRWLRGAGGSAVGLAVGWLAVRAIERKRMNEAGQQPN
ncbi:hypothetical protein [Aeromicrobium fastidiosum]|uniref:Uncharacterized protein n=2 Tax=Aeromicrobium fastidiosum TaxID=52699 RepID=A0A641AP61_9ACTN|nr:hypothetical protein [Aeromicrobium fastidiosum]KAA1378521.1 hypothetical protein ESP62_009235 [Aeromicrobium fastidiosum]MBP2392510.1 hypothetical protein [Aeromicrobium fastidiosum]